MTVISSADNPRYRELRKLATVARHRRASGLMLLDGVHLLAAWHERCGLPEQIVISRGAQDNPEIAALLASLAPLVPLELGPGLFGELSPVKTPSGILAVARIPIPAEAPRPDQACVLLERLQDPGNLGSILRSTAAAGLRQVLLSPGSADAWSPRALRAAMGAHFALNIYENCQLEDFLATFGGPVIATDRSAAQSLYETDLDTSLALLFGNEGGGLSPTLASLATQRLAIPMPGGAESLNVAAAAAICLFERVRQQQLRTLRQSPPSAAGPGR